ncbi:hypothetical protein FACS1894111_07040 [Clostridia bacterium]|nr:hypothetical protein FACS1894111_07040 [Clostridia bacterium]
MKIGIITFHAADNYGAVLQAYCLQEIVKSIGHEVKIINYAKPSQIDADALYPIHNGAKRLIKRLLMLPHHFNRKRRAFGFRLFRARYLDLTMWYSDSANLVELQKKFEAFVAGSDQIWNTTKEVDKSDAYFLAFAEEQNRKIAYAASIGEATESDLSGSASLMKHFDFISTREKRGSKVIGDITGAVIPVVLDPTLLIDRKVLLSISRKYPLKNRQYILYYTMDGFDKRKDNTDLLKRISYAYQLPVFVISPEWRKKGFQAILDADPCEFLWLIQKASLVCTNSFHGTALSIAFEKDFFVLEKYNGKDDRKKTTLSKLGLLSRMISDVSEIEEKCKEKINYTHVNQLLKKERKISMDFLKRALGERNLADE